MRVTCATVLNVMCGIIDAKKGVICRDVLCNNSSNKCGRYIKSGVIGEIYCVETLWYWGQEQNSGGYEKSHQDNDGRNSGDVRKACHCAGTQGYFIIGAHSAFIRGWHRWGIVKLIWVQLHSCCWIQVCKGATPIRAHLPGNNASSVQGSVAPHWWYVFCPRLKRLQ